MGYLTLFATAFAAATLLPAGSEVLLGGLAVNGYQPLLLWLVATTGNTLGAIVNWWLGREFNRLRTRPWFPVKETQLQRAESWFRRYGKFSLLFSWLPIVGDPLTVVAGILKTRLWLFTTLVLVGKGARYAVILYLALLTIEN